MKNNAIFARKCEINYQMWIKKCKSGKVSYSLLSYKWRNFQLVNFITICCTTTHSIPYCALCLFAFKSGPPEQTRSVLPMVIIVPQNKPRLRLFTKKWGLQSKPRLVCLLWGEGKRRYMSPNDAGHQSLRPCYRTRRYRTRRYGLPPGPPLLV